MRKIVAIYEYTDEVDRLLFQVVRYEPKQFKQRQPGRNGDWIDHLDCEQSARCKCKPKLPPVRRVLYRLREVIESENALILEGEKNCESAPGIDLVATCNPGGAGKWRSEYAELLRGKRVVVICDADTPGQALGREVARSLVGVATSVHLIEALPGVPQKGDLTDYLTAGGTRESLLDLIRATPELTPAHVSRWDRTTSNPWDAAESMETFLTGGDDEAEFLDEHRRLMVRECVTMVFSPRGLGKTLLAIWNAILLAKRGLRVLYIDRDNPRRVAKSRFLGFGAGLETPRLKVITREKCPPLTNSQAWASFPYADYDAVIIDSFDSAAEGIGEQDSGKPSRAIAPLLDIARRENGPAVLVLGNCVKSAAFAWQRRDRGSGGYSVRGQGCYRPPSIRLEDLG